MSATWVLALVLAGAPRVTASAEARVDAGAVANGLTARIGVEAESWTVTLEAAPGGVRFRARAPGRGLVEQTIEVPQGSSEERAIAVASAVALAIEQAPTSQESLGAGDSGESRLVSGPWLATLGAQAALGVRGPVDPSGGFELGGGRWIGPDRLLRVSLSLGWVHARRNALSVHAVQPGVQLDAGTKLGKRWWLGGGARIGVTTAWALDEARARGSALYGRIPATLEVQLHERWFARGVLGVELRGPTLRFRGASDRLRWGAVRPVAGLAVGANLP